MSTQSVAEHKPAALAPAAQLYIGGVFACTAALYATRWTSFTALTTSDVRLMLGLAAIAAVAQLFVVITPRNQSYHTTPVIAVAAALLLPPPALAFIAVVQHVPEWLKARYPWYIQSFNIVNYALSGLIASIAFSTVDRLGDDVFSADTGFFVAGVVAAASFLLVQHLVLALVLRFARGHSLDQSGLFTFQSLSTDLVLSLLGVAVAALWLDNPWLIVFALAPVLLIYRTLALPKLEAEARQDPKTELFNARYFSAALDEALEHASRAGSPLSILVADLDLLRAINNRYGHLAGDAVLAGLARVFERHLPAGGMAARFGGEEFAILLPHTPEAEAARLGEEIREAVAAERFEVETSSEPISATISIGVACFPEHGRTGRELIHQADLAAYRAKARGRNRVASASDPDVVHDVVVSHVSRPADEQPGSSTSGVGRPIASMPTPAAAEAAAIPPAPNYLALSHSLRAFVGLVGVVGVLAGVAGLVLDHSGDAIDIVVLVALVAVGQALAIEMSDHGSISLSAVGALAGAALFGPTAALALALAVCAVDWSARRGPLHRTIFNLGSLTLSSLVAAAAYSALPSGDWVYVLLGAGAGAAYYALNIGLLTTAITLETGYGWVGVLRSHFVWLFGHYVVYGVVGAMIAVAFDVAGLLALFVFAVPLILVRKAQLDYIAHTEESVRRLRDASATIERQNEALTEVNTLLRERATEAMETLAAAVDARDAYTAGHSRRVQRIAIAVGQELEMDAQELEALAFAALFHDVGKLAVPDTVLLKPGALAEEDWEAVREHPAEGERIIAHLGFLADSTPAIRHHHERFDGDGYPDGLRGEDIPLGARVLHVADALDSMVTTRVYRNAMTLSAALGEIRSQSGTQFCPGCVAALDRLAVSGRLLEALEPEASRAA